MKDVLPRFADHFPRLRRGHGGVNNSTMNDGRCPAPGCVINGGKEKHIDRAANREDWNDEHGIKD